MTPNVGQPPSAVIGQMTAEGGCPTRKKLLNLFFRGAQRGIAATERSGDRAPSYSNPAHQHVVL